MIDDQAMLECVSQTADMGRDSLNQVLDKVEDLSLKKVLRSQRDEYDKSYRAAGSIMALYGQQPKKAPPMAKLQAHMTSSIKTMRTEDPASVVAEMVIQGSTMGVTKVTRKLHEYQGDNREIRSLAEQLIKTEQANIEQMKHYL